MKKTIVIAVLFALMAGAVFAQDLKFDGYLNSGLGVVSVGDTPTVFKPFGVDSEQNGYRFRLNGSYQNEAKNVGVRLRLQSQGNLTTSTTADVSGGGGNTVTINNNAGYLSLPYIYGWVSFFDGIINLTGGIVDDSTFSTGDWWIADDVGEGLGLLLKITPVSGLSFGAGAYVISQQGSGSNNILSFTGTLPNFGNVKPTLDNAKYVFSASYTLKDVFRFDASFRTQNQAGWDGLTTFIGRQESSALLADVRLLAVKDLTAIVAVSLDKLRDFSDNGDIILSETFAYKVNSDFNAGLDMVQFLFSRPAPRDPGFLFRVWAAYAFDNVIPRLDLTYFLGGRSNANQEYHRRGYAVANTMDTQVFGIRPSVKFNLDSRTFLEIGDAMDINSTPASSVFTNVFYVDLKFSF